MALGGLGVSLAGFAGLIAALDQRSVGHTPVAAWRLRNIVIGGFQVTLGGFGTVMLFAATGQNLALTIRLISLAFIATNLRFLMWETRPGPAWPNERVRRVAMVGIGFLVVGWTAGAVLATLWILQALFLWQLGDPLSIFVNTVRDAAGGGTPGDAGDDVEMPTGLRKVDADPSSGAAQQAAED